MKGPFDFGVQIVEAKFQASFDALLSRSLQSTEQVFFDLGSSYPGDFQGEVLVDDCRDQLIKLFEELQKYFIKFEKELIISFTDELVSNRFHNALAERGVSSKILLRPMSLSTKELNDKKRALLLGPSKILALMNGLWGSDQRQHSVLTLWGDVEKVGAKWIHVEQSLNEIFEIEGNGGPRTTHVLIDGPFGDFSDWESIKKKKISDFGYKIRSLHFFSNCDEGKLIRVWNEFFGKDQCRLCLPCIYGRAGISAESIFTGFQLKAPYQCGLPERYNIILGMVSSLTSTEEVRS
ncbi:MAG: hypothetical protein K9K67_09455 [Bacteriovoracaceae bacterium]|nr:hypothetical protein [Bacteriovoracaceae bacterium]